MRRLLTLDVGNTRIKAAVFPLDACRQPLDQPEAAGTGHATGERRLCPQGTLSSLPEPMAQAAVMLSAGDTAMPALIELLAGDLADFQLVISSVNSTGLNALLEGWKESAEHSAERPPPLVLQAHHLPLPTALPDPGSTGIDRLLAAVAASVVRSPGQPVVIVDAGSATTVDVLSPAGVFPGGAILPGLGMAARSLHRETAQLPELDLATFDISTVPAIGTNTRQALASGLLLGHVAAIRGLAQAMLEEVASRADAAAEAASATDSPPPRLLLTGGGGKLLAPALPEFEFLPALCLQGMALAAVHLPGSTESGNSATND